MTKIFKSREIPRALYRCNVCFYSNLHYDDYHGKIVDYDKPTTECDCALIGESEPKYLKFKDHDCDFFQHLQRFEVTRGEDGNIIYHKESDEFELIEDPK